MLTGETSWELAHAIAALLERAPSSSSVVVRGGDSHAVRRNLARHFGLEALRHRWSGEGDPWARLFELGAEQRPPGENELVPYWIFETEGGVKVERRVPLMPLSREHGQLEQLKRHLALYRLAFGQPRQEDLLACLEKQGDLTAEQVDEWRIRLEP